jgi:hypothetical protein
VVHRTVRWCIGLSGGAPDCPVSQRSPAPMVSRLICGRQRGLPQRSADAPDCPVCTGQCSVRQRAQRSNGRMRLIWKAIAHRTTTVTFRWWTRHHSTEGRNCLPRLSPTAPSCLGAIKGTPRRMEENTKLSRNILRLPDSDSTHLILCVSDLSSI